MMRGARGYKNQTHRRAPSQLTVMMSLPTPIERGMSDTVGSNRGGSHCHYYGQLMTLGRAATNYKGLELVWESSPCE